MKGFLDVRRSSSVGWLSRWMNKVFSTRVKREGALWRCRAEAYSSPIVVSRWAKMFLITIVFLVFFLRVGYMPSSASFLFHLHTIKAFMEKQKSLPSFMHTRMRIIKSFFVLFLYCFFSLQLMTWFSTARFPRMHTYLMHCFFNIIQFTQYMPVYRLSYKLLHDLVLRQYLINILTELMWIKSTITKRANKKKAHDAK